MRRSVDRAGKDDPFRPGMAGKKIKSGISEAMVSQYSQSQQHQSERKSCAVPEFQRAHSSG